MEVRESFGVWEENIFLPVTNKIKKLIALISSLAHPVLTSISEYVF